MGLLLSKLQNKTQKHHQIKLLAETKLDSIKTKISKALKDNYIDDTEFTNILKEKNRYMELKEEIRRKSKKNDTKMIEEERKKLIDLGRQQEREEIAKNLTKKSA